MAALHHHVLESLLPQRLLGSLPPVVPAAEQLLEPFHEKAHVSHPPEE